MNEFVVEHGVLKQYSGDEATVIVPADVREIGYRAFCYCPTLQQIVIPAGVTKIGSQAFMGCVNLTEVALPDGITEIGYSAFERCIQLRSVQLPDGLRLLDRMAFLGCTALTEIYFPDTLQVVGRDALKDTAWLAQQEDGVVYAGRLVLFVKGAVGQVEIKPGTTKICADAFRGCTALTAVTLPDSLLEIEDRAFQYCRKLQQITIPQSVTRIGSRAFDECYKLQAVLHCEQAEIGRGCFADSASVRITAMNPADLPDNVRQSAILAFADDVCGGTMVNQAFYRRFIKYLQSRRKLLYPAAIQHWNLLQVMLQAQMIPLDDVDAILDTMLTGEQAEAVAALMQYKQSLTTKEEADLSDSWDDLELDWGLPEQEKTVEDLQREWGVKKNRDGTATLLRYHGNDVDVIVPQQIGEQAITSLAPAACSPRRYGIKRESAERLRKICTVTITEGILTIGTGAFADCENLRQVTLPESIIEIGSEAFQNCGNLTEIHLPSSVEKIGRAAFADCRSLQVVQMPQGVQVAEDAFAGCPVQFADI